MADCAWLQRRRAAAVIVGAFTDACAEAGIAEHPDGKCPAPDCRCRELADPIEKRATELAAQRLGISVAELEAATPILGDDRG